MHGPYGQGTKIGILSAPGLFSNCILLSLSDTFRHSLLLRKVSRIHSGVHKTLNYNNYFKSE